MTIAMLMRNTLNLARHAATLPRLKLRVDREAAVKDEVILVNKVVKPSDAFVPRQGARKRFITLTALSGFAVGLVCGIVFARGSALRVK